MTESSAGYPCRDGVSWEELPNLGKTRGAAEVRPRGWKMENEKKGDQQERGDKSFQIPTRPLTTSLILP